MINFGRNFKKRAQIKEKIECKCIKKMIGKKRSTKMNRIESKEKIKEYYSSSSSKIPLI